MNEYVLWDLKDLDNIKEIHGDEVFKVLQIDHSLLDNFINEDRVKTIGSKFCGIITTSPTWLITIGSNSSKYLLFLKNCQDELDSIDKEEVIKRIKKAIETKCCFDINLI